MSLKNKVIIVTGGSSGIGAATSIILAKEGAEVIIVGRNETNLIKVAEKCSQVGKKPMTIKADVSKDADCSTVIRKTLEKYGRIDVLINNAGILRCSAVLDKKHVEVFDETLNTNLRSVVVLTSLAAPYLIKSKGNIVNVSSIASSMASLTFSAYCTSKAALNHYSKVVAAELGKEGVRVNIVSPGPVDTPIFEAVSPGAKATDYNGMTVLNKVSQPEEVGDLIAYLASDKARSVTGVEYVIDCGAQLCPYSLHK